jgi:hypothetical protein
VRRVVQLRQSKHHTLPNCKRPSPLAGLGRFCRHWAFSHLFRLGANCSPHIGHSIRSKSMRRTSAGGIKAPHFGHTASSDARLCAGCTIPGTNFISKNSLAQLTVGPFFARPESQLPDSQTNPQSRSLCILRSSSKIARRILSSCRFPATTRLT